MAFLIYPGAFISFFKKNKKSEATLIGSWLTILYDEWFRIDRFGIKTNFFDDNKVYLRKHSNLNWPLGDRIGIFKRYQSETAFRQASTYRMKRLLTSEGMIYHSCRKMSNGYVLTKIYQMWYNKIKEREKKFWRY